ncbi:aminotransferase class I/II-fold pyridoxal phosphate-dependent enzyme [Bradyrhizobium japonicum]|uniref:aminotransferase class I/II-fold pyridoxal phosphate-dependent enzyme n=1 Tax=Bradyrhizobium japonicum TaxID=375 RepID=UPI001BA7DD95|nr:aminotransferase class I/II-fold pyridoxal phosphate-dependent enzyme [Bradyrhizobium japonicum]MBR0994724.1 aminotransferase class I/II-fold pyridoxal phosphate-dependent enzyme [Bradyrhizobium japonicum]
MDISGICITRQSTLRNALDMLDRSGLGVLLLVENDRKFERTVTDGDLRRLLLEGASLEQTLVSISERQSIVVQENRTRRAALELMQKHTIDHLPVVDVSGRVVDLIERRGIDEQILLSTPHMGEAERNYVEEAFRTNWIAPLGPNVDAFEAELAELVGANSAVALSSGTAAIHLALVLLGVGARDCVFCSSLTFAASVNPIVYQNAEPVLIDSEPNSWNMSPIALERALENARKNGRLPKAVIVVNLYGQSADMEPIVALCEKYRVPMVEDAAESLGAKYRGRHSGTFGRLGIYSFNGNKIITTSGGGMLVTSEKELANRARFLATQARDPAPHYQHSVIGYNYRMSNILAGVGRGQLKVLDERVQARRNIFRRYREAFANESWIELMPEPEWSYSTHWISAACLAPGSRLTGQSLVRHLSDEFIEARPIWKPMHLQPVFASCVFFGHGNTNISNDIFERGICLPSGSNLTMQQIDRVADAVLKIGRRLA